MKYGIEVELDSRELLDQIRKDHGLTYILEQLGYADVIQEAGVREVLEHLDHAEILENLDSSLFEEYYLENCTDLGRALK